MPTKNHSVISYLRVINPAPKLVGTITEDWDGPGTSITFTIPTGGRNEVLTPVYLYADLIVLHIIWTFDSQVTNPTITSGSGFIKRSGQSFVAGSQINGTVEVWTRPFDSSVTSATFTLPSTGIGACVGYILDQGGWDGSVLPLDQSTGINDPDTRTMFWNSGLPEKGIVFSVIGAVYTNGETTAPIAGPAGYEGGYDYFAQPFEFIGDSWAGASTGPLSSVPVMYVSYTRVLTERYGIDPDSWDWPGYIGVVPTPDVDMYSRTYGFYHRGAFTSYDPEAGIADGPSIPAVYERLNWY